MKIKNKADNGKRDTNELLFSLQQRNLVYNYNFLYYSNKTVKSGVVSYNHPDGWIYSDPGSGAQISSDGDCCRIVTGSDEKTKMSFKQALHEFPRWQTVLSGKKVTAKVHLNLSDDCDLDFTLSDGITSNRKSIFSGGDFELELTLQVDSNAEELYISIESSSRSAVIKISKVYANVGLIALENLPCIVNGIIGERKQYIATENPPAEELSLCCEAKELTKDQSRLHSVLNGRFGVGPNSFSLLPDMRGYFSRAWNNGAEIDPDRAERQNRANPKLAGDHVGTGQDDELKEHLHPLNYQQTAANPGPNPVIGSGQSDKTLKTGGNETRPKNMAELYTIKWA